MVRAHDSPESLLTGHRDNIRYKGKDFPIKENTS